MFDNAAINKLGEMRLSAMAESFKEQHNKTGISPLSFEGRFAFLVEAERLSRRNKRTGRLARQAGFRFPAAIENIERQGKRGIAKPETLKRSLGAYIKKAQNIILSGPAGVGKTYIACAPGHSACSQGIQVRYTRLSNFFQRVYEKGSYRGKRAQVPLLIACSEEHTMTGGSKNFLWKKRGAFRPF